jgi:hypothetical protein
VPSRFTSTLRFLSRCRAPFESPWTQHHLVTTLSVCILTVRLSLAMVELAR